MDNFIPRLRRCVSADPIPILILVQAYKVRRRSVPIVRRQVVMAHHSSRRRRRRRPLLGHHHRGTKVGRGANAQACQVIAQHEHIVGAAVKRHAGIALRLGRGAPSLQMVQNLGLGRLRDNLDAVRERNPRQRRRGPGNVFRGNGGKVQTQKVLHVYPRRRIAEGGDPRAAIDGPGNDVARARAPANGGEAHEPGADQVAVADKRLLVRLWIRRQMGHVLTPRADDGLGEVKDAPVGAGREPKSPEQPAEEQELAEPCELPIPHHIEAELLVRVLSGNGPRHVFPGACQGLDLVLPAGERQRPRGEQLALACAVHDGMRPCELDEGGILECGDVKSELWQATVDVLPQRLWRAWRKDSLVDTRSSCVHSWAGSGFGERTPRLVVVEAFRGEISMPIRKGRALVREYMWDVDFETTGLLQLRVSIIM